MENKHAEKSETVPKTIYDKDFELLEKDYILNYQHDLTQKLDADKSDFDQNRLNEIVLWKVNRYAKFDEELITTLNSISPEDEQIDLEKTKHILKLLLNTKGVQLAMASTILRFRNPKVYQIIDQRVFRIIYPEKELKTTTYQNEKLIEKQIQLYLTYLQDLREACSMLNIDFKEADRVLFMADRRVNEKIPLKNY
ncbi:hypothetical protein [Pedobacter glucosidilyticus]|uniref:hypothetical protein n=1 Tax=Pedobacter glucosidilyticus TaxID=1122941 RepID=UPI0026EF0675|nr:hypothetical protein [Pedobacter glucosidilyticus]